VTPLLLLVVEVTLLQPCPTARFIKGWQHLASGSWARSLGCLGCWQYRSSVVLQLPPPLLERLLPGRAGRLSRSGLGGTPGPRA